MLEKRQFAVRCHVQVWRFDVENDDDVRDAVVADDGGAASKPMRPRGTAAPKSTTVTESSGIREDVEPHQRLGWNRRKGERQAEKKVCFKIS